MLYIKTSRGWRPLHKQFYEIARSWQAGGWDVEERVARLDASDHWVRELSYNYLDPRTRLVDNARRRAKKASIEFSVSIDDIELPKICPLRHVPFIVGLDQHTDDSPTLDRKDPRRGYVQGNVWVISHKASRLKSAFTPNELKSFCENVLALDWISWTSDDEDALRRQQAEWKRDMYEKQKLRWWALWGPKSEGA